MHNLIELIRSFEIFRIEQQQVLSRLVLFLLLLVKKILHFHVPGRIDFWLLFFLRILFFSWQLLVKVNNYLSFFFRLLFFGCML